MHARRSPFTAAGLVSGAPEQSAAPAPENVLRSAKELFTHVKEPPAEGPPGKQPSGPSAEDAYDGPLQSLLAKKRDKT